MTDESTVMKVVNYIVKQGIDGVGPLCSSEVTAQAALWLPPDGLAFSILGTLGSHALPANTMAMASHGSIPFFVVVLR